MLFAVVILLRAIKILRAKNSTGDIPRTWNLHNFSFNDSSLSFVFIRFCSISINFLYQSTYTCCIFSNQDIKPYVFNVFFTLRPTILCCGKEESFHREETESLTNLDCSLNYL